MNDANVELAKRLVRSSYVSQGAQGLAARQKLLTSLLSERRLPERGWDETQLELLVRDAAALDSNNFLANVGAGEREARVACPLVARRHFGLAHGIGRSGDISAEQPKAAGSTLLARLCNLLAADALSAAGLAGLGDSTVLPVATGMALNLALLALARQRPAGARYVVWPRCDQKTCVKAIQAAGLEVVVVANRVEGDQVRTDVDAVRREIGRLGADAVVCVLSTTSCFAPRAPDLVEELARLCEEAGCGHIVNNAYGVQCASVCAAISQACRRGRVDAIVQSTDKNFCVPVGGAIIASPTRTPGLVAAVNRAYPGRACMAPLLDLLLTLLHWGGSGWRAVLRSREELFPYLREQLSRVAQEHGERLLHTPDNPISLGITLSTLAPAAGQSPAEAVSSFGSMLFLRCVSGTRTVPLGRSQDVGGVSFLGYGAHVDDYPVPYLTAAASLGMSREDVDEFCLRLSRCFRQAAKGRDKHHTS